MKEHEKSIHFNRVRLAKDAQIAYDCYVQGFLSLQYAQLFEAFINIEMDVEKLVQLKNMQLALTTLESAIKTDIAFGEVSQQALTEGRGK